MKKYKLLIVLSLSLSFCIILSSYGQGGSGSATVENSTVLIAEGTTEMRFSQGTYFGPAADWTVDGTLELWSENIWIAPSAKFRGMGKIIIHNPGDSPYYTNTTSGATYIDGNNGEFINLFIEHRNNANVILLDHNDPGYGTSNPSGSSSAQLNIGSNLELAVNGANIILNGSNLAFNTAGTIENYDAQRMVVTSNSIDGHMIKEFGSAGRFTFPVGIEEQDYTPATVNTLTGGKLFVSVQEYSRSTAQMENRELGMNRSWHIYGANAMKADLTLTHNAETNGKEFKDQDAHIAQYASGLKWDLLATEHRSTSVHSSFNASIVANMIESGVWITKVSKQLADFFIPNVFTPNGDGNNDVFEIKGLDHYDRVEVLIFNRWGNEVYRDNHYQNSWDGQGLNEGTYYYLVTTFKEGKEKVYKSWVLLKR